jgi:hypothetical protein
MDIAQTRIECLQLAHRADLTPQDVVDRAKFYESYVLENVETRPVARRGRPPSKKPALEVRNDPE